MSDMRHAKNHFIVSYRVPFHHFNKVGGRFLCNIVSDFLVKFKKQNVVMVRIPYNTPLRGIPYTTMRRVG